MYGSFFRLCLQSSELHQKQVKSPTSECTWGILCCHSLSQSRAGDGRRSAFAFVHWVTAHCCPRSGFGLPLGSQHAGLSPAGVPKYQTHRSPADTTRHLCHRRWLRPGLCCYGFGDSASGVRALCMDHRLLTALGAGWSTFRAPASVSVSNHEMPHCSVLRKAQKKAQQLKPPSGLKQAVGKQTTFQSMVGN